MKLVCIEVEAEDTVEYKAKGEVADVLMTLVESLTVVKLVPDEFEAFGIERVIPVVKLVEGMLVFVVETSTESGDPEVFNVEEETSCGDAVTDVESTLGKTVDISDVWE